MKSLEEIVAHYRKTPIRGKCVDLVPFLPEHAPAIVELRNSPEARYFLNQGHESTIESQMAWYEGYSKRKNDIFWVIQDKTGNVVGCNRLYDISEKSAEKGSQIVDQRFTRLAPIAIEADLAVIKLAFDMNVESVLARIRHDNPKVHSMNEKMGFRRVSEDPVNGVLYYIFKLEKDSFRPEKLDQLIDYWSQRSERAKT